MQDPRQEENVENSEPKKVKKKNNNKKKKMKSEKKKRQQKVVNLSLAIVSLTGFCLSFFICFLYVFREVNFRTPLTHTTYRCLSLDFGLNKPKADDLMLKSFLICLM